MIQSHEKERHWALGDTDKPQLVGEASRLKRAEKGD